MRLILYTQTWENYAAHAWDGEGEVPQYWKAKGGEEYEVKMDFADNVKELVDKATAKIEISNEYFLEEVRGWEVLKDDELTDFEEFCKKDGSGEVHTVKLDLTENADG